MSAKARIARRRRRYGPIALLLAALVLTGGVYAAAAPAPAGANSTNTADIETGRKLFAANCATCHGAGAAGTTIAPSLIGAGAAAVDFQVSTGRMPRQSDGPQAPVKPPQMTAEQTAQLAAYVASLGNGPPIPTGAQVDPALGNPAAGAEVFRTNCAMCHNAVGAGGALSEGKYAPSLSETSPRNIYQAMITGPQSMPIFNDATITPQDKRDVIAYLEEQHEGSAGGLTLGGLGPVSEAVWAWVVGIGLLLGAAVWIGAKSS